jgi:uncharacterized iron-regulated protein
MGPMRMRARLGTLSVVAFLGAAACAPSTRVHVTGAAPVPESRFYDTAARRYVGFDQLIAALARANIVFFGEEHDDPSTHRTELAILAGVGSVNEHVVVSLEMFERDAQPALDDYLAGRIAENEFLARSRPWDRYTTDYRALVELARARGWPVLASNVPRALATAVSHTGMAVLDTLSAPGRAFAAHDLQCPHDAYYGRFAEEMKGHSVGGGPPTAGDTATARVMTDRFYEAQCLKDETMGESIAGELAKDGSDAIVVHFTGAFHSDFGQGTVARARRRRPNARTIVLSAVPVDDPAHADAVAFADRGDYVILTRRSPAAAKP